LEATPQFTLDLLDTGATGRVVRVEGQDALAERLVDHGFWPGTQVSVLRRSAFGGPVAYRLRGFRLALRRSEAVRIVIAPDV
jgi:ferrous iron transport protein A